MNLDNFNTMFRPNSVAVIGATEEPGHPGAVLMRNILASKFIGPVIPVHETLSSCFGLPVYREIDTLPLTPDVALICSEPEPCPTTCSSSAGAARPGPWSSATASPTCPPTCAPCSKAPSFPPPGARTCASSARRASAFISPATGINASLGHAGAENGRVAFITESDSLFTSVLDWAGSRNIGFSHFISLGRKLDFGFGDLLDWLNADPNTRAVMLYVEEIGNARKFMSAARATARNKPLLVIKGGRPPEAAELLGRYSRRPQGLDAVYDAAFRRSGMLRVGDIDSLFDAVETIVRSRPLKGERLAILSNGRSPGILVQDMLVGGGGTLARLNEETRTALMDLLAGEPGGPAKAFLDAENPLNITAHASPERYAEALKILLKAEGVDAVLVLNVPSPLVDGQDVARAVAGAARRAKRTVLASWIRGGHSQKGRAIHNEAGSSTYWTPDKGVRAFLNLVLYGRNQDMLMQTPASLPTEFMPDTSTARMVVDSALEAGRSTLTVPEAMDVLDCYAVPVVETRLSGSAEAAVAEAAEMGFPVALKVLSPDSFCKTRAGGVALDLEAPAAGRVATGAGAERVAEAHPDCRVAGYVVQRMGRRPRAREVFIRASTDPVFGPYIHFGQGGADTEILRDEAMALPPLNMALARELISRTAVSHLLAEHHGQPGADLDALCLTLVKVSHIIIDLPEVQTLEINPLFVDQDGVLAWTPRSPSPRPRASPARAWPSGPTRANSRNAWCSTTAPA
jgi:acetyltransferase